MNSMNDERFFDLAMKVISRQCTDAERTELDALLAREPELKKEFERIETEVRTAKQTLPLVDAMQATAGELPAYARGRLQTKVRQALGRPTAESEPDRSPAWGWRWVLGLATATALVLIVALPMIRTPSAPRIQLAMLDTMGGTRGSDTNETPSFHEVWSTASLDSFTNAKALRGWEAEDKPDTVKIIYDRAAAEVKVVGKWRGKSFEKTFLIETDLAVTLKDAKTFIVEQTKR